METDDELIINNMKLAYKLAWEYYIKFNKLFEIEELQSVALFALVKAAKTYDSTKVFSTYAYRCIKNELLYFYRQNNRYSNYYSLSDKINFNEDLCFEDVLKDEFDLEEIFIEQNNLDTLKTYINSLDDKEKVIVNLILDGYTQKQIAQKLNVTQPQICNLYKKIVNKLRYKYFRDLRDQLEQYY